MADDIDKKKQEFEIEKLQAEITSLRQPFAKPSNWIALIVAAGGILTAITQWQVSDYKQQKAALEAERRLFKTEKLLETKGDSLKQTEAKLRNSQKKRQEAESANLELIEMQGQLQVALSEIENKIAKKSELLAQLDERIQSRENSGEAREIIEESKLLDKQIAEDLSVLRSEYQLTGELTQDEVVDLIRKINAADKPVRLSAMRVLTDDYKDSAFVIDAVLELFSKESIDNLSASGRINGLYFLNATTPDAWSAELKTKATRILMSMEDRHKQGIARIGPQTRGQLSELEQFLRTLNAG